MNSYFESMGNGYHGYSMSNNAREAYSNGEKPLSQWTKSDILWEVKKIDAEKAEKLKKVKLAVLKKKLLCFSSYHHTSSYYNSTDFYCLDEYVIWNLTDEDIEEWMSEEVEKPKKLERKVFRGDIYYLVWDGTRKHPHATEHKMKNVNIEERGCFYIVTDDNGNVLMRKKIDSRGTEVVAY